VTDKANEVAWLTQEVRDLLDLSSVGLYEFVWLLRSSRQDLSEAQLHDYAENALRTLLENGEAVLARLEWPGGDVVAMADSESLHEPDWKEPGPDSTYLAVCKP
jgi:hypothetical protein